MRARCDSVWVMSRRRHKKSRVSASPQDTAAYPVHPIPERSGGQRTWSTDKEPIDKRCPAVAVHIHIAVLVSKGTGFYGISD